MARLKGREARLDIPVSVSEIPIMSDIPTNDVTLAITDLVITETLLYRTHSPANLTLL